MGKGDKKTKKGKRIQGSYGNSRKRKVAAPIVVTKSKAKPAKEETSEEVKKVAVKKTATKAPAAKTATVKKPTASKSTEAKEQ